MQAAPTALLQKYQSAVLPDNPDGGQPSALKGAVSISSGARRAFGMSTGVCPCTTHRSRRWTASKNSETDVEQVVLVLSGEVDARPDTGASEETNFLRTDYDRQRAH